jgi:beta-lactamase superfamily II metal-dependent hydrolase
MASIRDFAAEYLRVVGDASRVSPGALESDATWSKLGLATTEGLKRTAGELQMLVRRANPKGHISDLELNQVRTLVGGFILAVLAANFPKPSRQQAMAELRAARSELWEASDAATRGKYHFLDVGNQKYGDCILVEFGDVRVLIDGSHEKDFEGQEGFDSTPEQLAQLFGTDQTPHPITLMVVTHCHQDHIGALPKLVSSGVIKPKWALITDHKLGFGRTDDDSDAANRADLQSDRTRTLAALLREEDASDLSDAEFQEFADGAATVESKYLAMIKDLRAKGVKVIEYRGRKLPDALIEDLKPSQMIVLGPSSNQLVLAAAQIAKTNQDAVDAVADALRQDATVSDREIYRRIVSADSRAAAMAAGRDATEADSSNLRGNGMNCQSITLAFGPPGARALLAGDMQFAEPGVKGANQEVLKLRQKVKAHGPYKLFKTTHHTSHNGQDDDIFADLGDPPIIVHTGGRNDPSHPFPGTLELLRQRRADIVFARTDRNGLITVQPHRDVEEAVTKSRGRFDDFSDNARDTPGSQVPSEVSSELLRWEAEHGKSVAPRRASPQIVIVNLPDGPVNMTVSGVDIVVSESGRVEISRGSIDPEPEFVPLPNDPRSNPLDIKVAGGRTLSKLLFVTNSRRLGENIGRNEAQSALAAIARTPHRVLEISSREGNALRAVQQQLRNDREIAGVVILGGYDVVPSIVVDVLPPRLRQTLGRVTRTDGDDFFVWSDEPYADIDGDHIGERPVSRIPDARDSKLFLKALQSGGVRPEDRFGVRNIARPFADDVWPEVRGRRALNVSRTFLSTDVMSEQIAMSSQYFMLHGSDSDATEFSGEDDGSLTRAFSIDKVPQNFNGIVFTGCCWGALTVTQKALEIGSRMPAPRVAERSIALSFLKAGANAFIGCTGSHYSGPDPDPTVNYALPLHAAFWKTFPAVGHGAALALYGARKYYGDLIARDTQRREPLDIARRLKNRAQFTCLGLGW